MQDGGVCKIAMVADVKVAGDDDCKTAAVADAKVAGDGAYMQDGGGFRTAVVAGQQ